MNTLDVRDLIEQFEGLETEYNDLQDVLTDAQDAGDATAIRAAQEDLEEFESSAEKQEFDELKELLEELAGNGGDHQWRGEWYPITLIDDYDWVNYVQELVDDIGDLPRGIPSYIEIDWEATALNVQRDYSSVEYQGTTYWYR